MQERLEHRAWLALIITIAFASLTAILTRNDTLGFAGELIWFPGAVEAGQIWRLFTYAFVIMDPISLAFTLLIFWFILPGVEDSWGSRAVLIFFLLASCCAAGCAILLSHILPALTPGVLIDPGAALLGFMYVYGMRNPDQTFFLFFVIPVKARWFAPGYVLIRVLIALSTGSTYAIVVVLCECAGAALALLLRAGALRLIKTRSAKKRARLQESPTDSKIERAHASLWERYERETDAEARALLLAGEKEKKFDFTVCAAGDFTPRDAYCQACAAFGFCLSRFHEKKTPP